MSKQKEDLITAVTAAIKQSKKYGDTSEATIRQLAEEAARQHKKPKAAIKAVRAKLHSIMAPYLGDPDYAAMAQQLTDAFAADDQERINQLCLDSLDAHLSTRERLPIMADFYKEIFAVTGQPHAILDIACALNPLALRWMYPVIRNQLSVNGERLKFYAYDIHEPRIGFINHYFQLEGMEPLARVQDVAMQFPQEQADVALFLKEMPRFTRNYGDLGRPLLQALNVRWLIISYPSVSTHGGRNLTNRYRDFMQKLIDGLDWPLTELLFEGELVFIIDKSVTDD
ncbi:MAG: 16S rRNA methyltransferase [Ardenticatenaceae bacterium]|nr:MAG: 16S rRNA methyltransferase [Ardenticatenaceae bacterium]